METKELLTEETIPTEEAEVQKAEEGGESEKSEAAEKDAECTENTEASEGTEPEKEEGFLIRYMHEDLNLSKEEAKRFAQLGKHYEDNIKKTIDDLDYIATLQGKTVKELVSELVSGVDKSYREELIENLGEDNPLVEEMLELRRSKNKKSYEDAKAQRETEEKEAEAEAQKSAADKLAEQFEAVRETFPEYDTMEKVPDVVIKRAVKSGDLEKEMLRYELSERKKVEAAKASEEKNKNENVGSVQTEENVSGIMDAFLSGIKGR